MPVAHFVIEGSFVADTARDLMLEDQPGKALRLILNTLIGDGRMRAAIAILSGTHDLQGDSNVGLQLVDASNDPALKRYRDTVARTYGGRYREHGVWRRPVAYMIQFGPVDADWAVGQIRDRTLVGAAGLREFEKIRASYYCSRDQKAVLLQLPDPEDDREPMHAWVIMEICSDPPQWWSPPTTAQEAVNEALRVGRKIPEKLPETAPSRKSAWLRPSKEELQRRVEASEARAAEFDAECERIASEVRAQAGDDTFELTLESGRVLTVPRAPFARWALRRTEQADQAPPWNNVSSVGMKLSGDDPNHTDWVLGSGLKLSEAYDQDVQKASYDAMFRLQKEAREPKKKQPFAGIFSAIQDLHDAAHDAAVLVDSGEKVGIVGDTIKVFADSSGSRVAELGDAIGVIVEQGGPLAHLVIVAPGYELTILRCKNALELFPPGTEVSLNPARGRITILED